MATLDVRQLLRDVGRILSTDARMKDISWSMEVPGSLPSVRGDKAHLTQAILNLVLNAFDSVSESRGPREVTLCARLEDSGGIRVSVRDSGKGVPPSVMPRLFDPFFTTKATGMGMGLTIVRSIVENHGGRIWATQNPYRGTTFEFVLPDGGHRAAVSVRFSHFSRVRELRWGAEALGIPTFPRVSLSGAAAKGNRQRMRVEPKRLRV